MLSPLSLSEATKLYKTLGSYLDMIEPDMRVIDAMNIMLKEMKARKDGHSYANALEIMTGDTIADLTLQYDVKQLLDMFIDGLRVNRILDMKKAFGEFNGR